MHIGLSLGLTRRGGGGIGASPFAPTDIPDLALWLDASDASTITDVEGSVSQWDDKSGGGNHATQGSGSSQPKTGTRSVNGLNVIDNDGSNDALLIPSALYTYPAGSTTSFIVMQRDTSNQMRSLYSVESSSVRFGFESNNTTIRYTHGTGNGTGPQLTGLTYDTNAHIVLGTRSATTRTVYQDGGTGVSDTGAVDATLSSFGTTSTSGLPLDGTTAEIVLYSALLADAQINQVGNYLASKWGIIWTDV